MYLPEYLSKKQKKFMNNIWIRILLSSFDLNGVFAFGVINSDLKTVDISPYVSTGVFALSLFK